MNKYILILLLVMFSTPAFAGDYIFHTGEVITGKRSSCGKVCSSRPDALKVDVDTYESTTLKWHKVVSGEVVEMSQAEKDLIIQVEDEARVIAIEEALDKFEVSNIELMTALIQRINTRIVDDITKAEIIQQIKDNR
jgi:hypothetical protein